MIDLPISAPISSVATFALSESGEPRTENGNVVYPAARLLAIGDYGDKGFKSPVVTADLQAMADTFDPARVRVNIEHESPALGTADGTATLLHGKLGNVRRVWVDETGQWLKGEVAIPAWLDSALTEAGDGARQLSVEVYPRANLLCGLAITKTPRCTGAALLSKLKGLAPMSETLTPEQETNLFDKFAARFHSLFKKHETSGTWFPTENSLESGVGNRVPENKFPETIPPTLGETRFPTIPDPMIAVLSAQVATLKADKIASDAARFADSEIAESRAMPAERVALMGAYSDAASDDAQLPDAPVTFSDGGKSVSGTRVAALIARQKTRPSHTHLFAETLTGLEVLSTGDETNAATRKAELMAHTPLGRKILKETK